MTQREQIIETSITEATAQLKKAQQRLKMARAAKDAEATIKKSRKARKARKARKLSGTLATAKGSRREILINAFLSRGSITLAEIKNMKSIQNPDAAGFFGSKTMRYLVATGVAKKTGRGKWSLASGFTGGQLRSTASVKLNRIYQ